MELVVELYVCTVGANFLKKVGKTFFCSLPWRRTLIWQLTCVLCVDSDRFVLCVDSDRLCTDSYNIKMNVSWYQSIEMLRIVLLVKLDGGLSILVLRNEQLFTKNWGCKTDQFSKSSNF
jgi:hypothetical protein